MRFVTDPSTSLKVGKMKQRVLWDHPEIVKRRIDQTCLAIDEGTDAPASNANPFSFLVIGDSGTGKHSGDNPQRRVAEWLMSNGNDGRFVLHTGDLVYLVGAKNQYLENFIKPYREWLMGGENPKRVRYDRLVFKLPFLPVLGNHDYYDVPFVYGALSLLLWPLRWLLQRQVDLDYGYQGSHQGDVFARAFIDYLKDYRLLGLASHLDQHYTATVDTKRCLRYQPDHFTRLPNRYYTFRQGGIDFFALDSNTFNSPLSPDEAPEAQSDRQNLLLQRQTLLAQRARIYTLTDEPDNDSVDQNDQSEVYAQLEQLDEELRDIDKQLAHTQGKAAVDWEQLNWLKQHLIASWKNKAVRGRVLYFHHPPYVTEESKWYQGQTLAIRHRLRRVLDDVQTVLNQTVPGDWRGDRPIVDLVISGHAHCFEYLQTLDTGHADSHTHWLICGGSGFSLRRQRPEGNLLHETVEGESAPVAQSIKFVGRSGHGREKRRPYSGLKIDVHPGTPPRFTVHPYVVEKYQHRWERMALDPIDITPGINASTQASIQQGEAPEGRAEATSL